MSEISTTLTRTAFSDAIGTCVLRNYCCKAREKNMFLKDIMNDEKKTELSEIISLSSVFHLLVSKESSSFISYSLTYKLDGLTNFITAFIPNANTISEHKLGLRRPSYGLVHAFLTKYTLLREGEV